MKHKTLAVGMLWIMILSGCAAVHKEKIPQEAMIPERKRNIYLYTEFVRENMIEINARYSKAYVAYEFIVDTDYGSTKIQNLIDPASAGAITAELMKGSDAEHLDELILIYQYIINNYDYILEPLKWQSVEETIESRKGDCKSLSLLLMSFLVSAGYDTYAGISNGHMWVNVNENNQWYVLELDPDPERNTIYRIPGFYQYPLYRIHPDHSEKRKSQNSHEAGQN